MRLYPNPVTGFAIDPFTIPPVRLSVGRRHVVSNPATPNVDMSRRMRATALSIPRPAGDESSGMKGDPTDATPYTVPCRASRTERQNARLSRAAHAALPPQPYSPA